MKFLLLFVGILFLGAGSVIFCMYTQKNTSPKKVPQKFQPIIMSQYAVFFVGDGYTGGMGSMPILDEQGNIQMVDGLPVYIDEKKVAEIKARGHMPSCVEGKPRIEVIATIHLEKKTMSRTSIEGAPDVAYYMASVDDLERVHIDAVACT